MDLFLHNPGILQLQLVDTSDRLRAQPNSQAMRSGGIKRRPMYCKKANVSRRAPATGNLHTVLLILISGSPTPPFFALRRLKTTSEYLPPPSDPTYMFPVSSLPSLSRCGAD